MSEQYQHVPLKTERSIRVLHVQPASSPSDELQCKLQDLSLNEDSKSYVALSYTWDSQIPTFPINCDGRALYITPNCHAALVKLRSQDISLPMWVDSICIDQNSVEERNRQVAIMDKIYRQALSVVVWLGEGDDKSEAALSRLGNFGKTCLNAPEMVEEHWQRLEKEIGAEDDLIGPIFRQNWFHRMWTIQEVTLSDINNVYISCGDTGTRWLYVFIALKGLGSYHHVHYVKWLDTIGVLTYLNGLFLEKHSSWKAQNEEDFFGGPQCRTIFSHIRSKACKDPKDKVFALYGVMKPLEISIPAPDYRKPVEEIYTEAMIACIHFDKNLLPLTEVASQQRNKSLPSWVPDWNSPGFNPIDPRSWVAFFCEKASGTSKPAWDFSTDGKKIILRGKPVDEIKFLGNVLDFDERLVVALDAINNKGKPPNSVHSILEQSLLESSRTLAHWVIKANQWKEFSACDNTRDMLLQTLVWNVPSEDDTRMIWWDLVFSQCMKMETEAITSVTFILRRNPPMHLGLLTKCGGKNLFLTRDGRFGIGANSIQPGDQIALIAGIGAPMILRPKGDVFHLVSLVYIYGMMDGECWTESEVDLMDITIV